jgi:hypothetical protein
MKPEKVSKKMKYKEKIDRVDWRQIKGNYFYPCNLLTLSASRNIFQESLKGFTVLRRSLYHSTGTSLIL